MVLDDGWFSSRIKDDNGLGDWYENRDRLPEELAAYFTAFLEKPKNRKEKWE